ncbi:MAG: protein DpdE [Microcystaceae cyanobacterium]
MKLGLLVYCTDNKLGIGKIVAIEDYSATVEYFVSFGQLISQELAFSSLNTIKLQHQTRCYIYAEESETWQMGRIYNWDAEKGQYTVDLPNNKTIYVDERHIYVRCNRPIEDPTGILAKKGQETPYFYHKRSKFWQTVIKQRAISRGMTGLLSANIELFPHQVEVIRRVLEDPIQRYLLADEVGLGKTIESGAILRQFLLDNPTEKALILIPPSLYYQWEQELETKFYLSHFPDRVTLISTEDKETLINLTDHYHFMIIDEAHHIAAMAMSKDSENRRYFETCRKLAHQAEKLLLLSATPVLNHEQDFLAMLHLLDPDTYQLDDLDGFRERVQKRREIGQVLLSFKEGVHPFVLKKSLKTLRALFNDDTILLSLIEALQTQIANKEDEGINQQILAIRSHISDTYRLHRRMLRNRRDKVEDVIFDRNAVPQLEYDLDERVAQIHELLDEWRVVAPDDLNYQQIFSLLFRASNTWLGVLKQVIDARLNRDCHDSSTDLIQDIGKNNHQILINTTLFEEETTILTGILEILETPSEEGDRLELLKMIILYYLADTLNLQSFQDNLDRLQKEIQARIKRPFWNDKFKKLVIFTSFTQTCRAIVQYLSQILGQDTIISYQRGYSKETADSHLDRFKNSSQCFILVADSSGEEGLNLQFVDGVIHFDLPLSPNQLEQRLGRVDRIGGKLTIKSWLLAGSDNSSSFFEGWYQLLDQGLNIFDQSIASLQFYIEAKLPEWEILLFELGTKGIIDNITTIQEEIKEEKVKISEQYALDEIDARAEVAQDYFKQLEEYDEQHELIEKAVEAYLCHGLMFQKRDDNNLDGVRAYKPTQQTLIPLTDLKNYFAPCLSEKGVYNRRLANRYSEVHLYRIGEELIDTLTHYLNWDDRGKAFAMWRQDAHWDESEGAEWLGFRFDYLIELDWQKILEDFNLAQFNVNAVKRQGDTLFPPSIESIFLDQYFEPVEDEKLLEILHRPFSKKAVTNLAKNRLPILDEFIDPSQWENFCYEGRKQSEICLRQSARFQEICQTQTEIAKLKLTTRLSQLQSRYNRFPQPNLWDELQVETALKDALLAAICQPKCHLDALGFMIISGRSLNQDNEFL